MILSTYKSWDDPPSTTCARKSRFYVCQQLLPAKNEETTYPAGYFLRIQCFHHGVFPYAPFPSASGFGGGFRCLNTFSEDIWSTRD